MHFEPYQSRYPEYSIKHCAAFLLSSDHYRQRNSCTLFQSDNWEFEKNPLVLTLIQWVMLVKNIKRDRGVRLRVRILQKVIPVPSPDQDRPYVKAPPAAVCSRLTQGLQGCFDRGKREWWWLLWNEPLVNHLKWLTDQLFDDNYGNFLRNGGRYVQLLCKNIWKFVAKHCSKIQLIYLVRGFLWNLEEHRHNFRRSLKTFSNISAIV